MSIEFQECPFCICIRESRIAELLEDYEQYHRENLKIMKERKMLISGIASAIHKFRQLDNEI